MFYKGVALYREVETLEALSQSQSQASNDADDSGTTDKLTADNAVYWAVK